MRMTVRMMLQHLTCYHGWVNALEEAGWERQQKGGQEKQGKQSDQKQGDKRPKGRIRRTSVGGQNT